LSEAIITDGYAPIITKEMMATLRIRSNVELCHTLFYLTNVAYAHNDDQGEQIYTSTMKMFFRTRKFSAEDTKQAMTLLFVLYGSKPKNKPGLIRMKKK
jgi:hypothetical protein